eukprot:scaffold5047_cov127-Skeletonema_menzelii.AAC.1
MQQRRMHKPHRKGRSVHEAWGILQSSHDESTTVSRSRRSAHMRKRQQPFLIILLPRLRTTKGKVEILLV